MKTLIFSSYNDFSAIESAVLQLKQGNTVIVLCCDKNMRVCMHNNLGSSALCDLCKSTSIASWRRSGVYDKVDFRFFSNIVSEKDKEIANNFDISFSSVLELKDIKYKKTEVGYGAFSSYVSMSRNVMPPITPEFKQFISFLIRKEIEMHEVIERIVKEEKIDLFIFHNGRFSSFKPFLGIAQNMGIPFYITEHVYKEGKLCRDFFVNSTPHEMKGIIEHMRKNWEDGSKVEDVEKSAREFYERRRLGKPTGDVVYTKSQIKGLLPDKWDKDKENITIFNSSEDEFCAVSKTFDSYTLFSSQYEALKTIFEHYKNDNNKHFYVRIHPNLKNVPYKSHLALYELQYDNVTFIRPESAISSYDLLDNSSKVIIFDSTIGIEATYWRKPVIALTHFYYSEIDAVYTPKSEIELWSLIDTKNLKDKYNHDVLLFGYFLYRKNLPEMKYVDYRVNDFSFLGRKVFGANSLKVFNSYKIMPIIELLYRRISFLLPFKKFKKIPGMETYKGDY